MITGTPISELPTGTISGVNGLMSVVPMSVGTPPSTIQANLAQTLQFVQLAGAVSPVGGNLTYVTGTSYRVEAGTAIVNNQLLTWASPITRSSLTFTSGSMSYVYLYNSGGSAAVEESTTVPAWDTTFQYYKKTGDVSRRCIGFLQANQTNSIRPFINHVDGRTSEFTYIDGVAKVVVSAGSSSSAWAAIDLSSYAPAHTSKVLLIAKLFLAGATDEGVVAISPRNLLAVTQQAPYQVRARTNNAGSNVFFGNTWEPVLETQTIYYRLTVNSGSPTAQIEVYGARIIR